MRASLTGGSGSGLTHALVVAFLLVSDVSARIWAFLRLCVHTPCHWCSSRQQHTHGGTFFLERYSAILCCCCEFLIFNCSCFFNASYSSTRNSIEPEREGGRGWGLGKAGKLLTFSSSMRVSLSITSSSSSSSKMSSRGTGCGVWALGDRGCTRRPGEAEPSSQSVVMG